MHARSTADVRPAARSRSPAPSPDAQVVAPAQEEAVLLAQEQGAHTPRVASELDGDLLCLYDVQKLDLPIG